MKFPVLIVNLKNYREASGDDADRFFRYAGMVGGVNVLVAPPILDISRYIALYPDILIAQSVDVVDYGSSTGHVPLKRLIDMGVRYSLLNHSEYKLPHDRVAEIVRAAEEYDFDIVVCIDSIEELRSLVDLGVCPSAYAIEPPELIGSGRSVSKYKPQVIVDAVSIGEENGIPVLCGAGISDGDDVRVALELGSRGVLVASAIVRSGDPLEVMKAMVDAMRL
jgi:triosephosphate isomerase